MRRSTGNDDSLMQRAAHGDTDSFTELVRRHRSWVLRLLQPFTTDSEAAEDLAQEVFTRLHRHAVSYQGRGQFIPYLKQLALNVGRSHLRRVPGVTLVAWDEVAEPLTETLVDSVLTRQIQAELHASVAALPPDQREAVLLHYFAGWTVPEIATRVCCPAGTVKSRLFHGLRKIRETLNSQKEEIP